MPLGEDSSGKVEIKDVKKERERDGKRVGVPGWLREWSVQLLVMCSSPILGWGRDYFFKKDVK